MPIVANEGGRTVSTDVPETRGVDGAYAEARRCFAEFMREVLPTGLLSEQEVSSQERWIESIADDPKKIQEALDAYKTNAQSAITSVRQLYNQEFIKPLDDALEMGAISSQSYQEWLTWVHDGGRRSEEKKKSIRETLPAYLGPRIELAKKRAEVMRQVAKVDLKSLKDKDLLARIDTLGDNHSFFTSLDLLARQSLVSSISAKLAVQEGGDAHRQLYDKAKGILDQATQLPQPALHRDKVHVWLERIFKSGASTEQIEAFLKDGGEGTLPGLIKVWRVKAVEFWILREDPAFKGIRTQFVSTKGLLAMNYKDRVVEVNKMHALRERARALRSNAASRVASNSQALSPGAQSRWLDQYLFNGSLTLGELESIIGGEMARHLSEKVVVLGRFERAVAQGKRIHGFRGKPLLERGSFLKLHYDRQTVEVQDLEARLRSMENTHPDFLFIRNLMDRKDWEGAMDLIHETQSKPMTFEHWNELSSMEAYVKLHRAEGKPGKDAEKPPTVTDLGKKVDEVIDSTSGAFQPMCITLCERGAKAIGAASWASYNRDWCWQQGYLNAERERIAIHKGKTQARTFARRKQRKGVVSETIHGSTGEEQFIELSRNAPTNVCVDIGDSGAMGSFTEQMSKHRDDGRALYWTNAIFHQGGAPVPLEEQISATKHMYDMRNLLRKIEAKGGIYHYRNTSTGIPQPSQN